jgi:hypothetical protein
LSFGFGVSGDGGLTEIEGPVGFEARALELEHGDRAGDRHALVLGLEVRLPLAHLVLLPPDVVDEEARNVPRLVALLLEKVKGLSLHFLLRRWGGRRHCFETKTAAARPL